MLTVFLFGNQPASGDYEGLRHVLLLHSYHQGMLWTDSMVKGIVEGLDVEKNRIDLHIEYLDTLRYPDMKHREGILQILRNKYSGTILSCIIVSDENALHFMLGHGAKLFPDVPVVFTGVHYYDAAWNAAHGNITGVVEAYNVNKTLTAALSIHPETETVYIINDQTPSGLAMRNAIEKARTRFTPGRRLYYLDKLSMEELESRLRDLPERSIVLMLSFTRDRLGRVFRFRDSMARVLNACGRPIYSVWGFYLGRGIVGGALTDGAEHGRIAASMAVKKILAGEKASSIPVITAPTDQLVFDWHQLQRFRIKETDLPDNSIVVNRPSSMMYRYRYHIAAVVMVVLLQGGLIIYLMTAIRYRKQAELALKESEENHRATLNSIGDAVIATDREGRVTRMNPVAEILTDWQYPDARGKKLADIFRIVDRDTREKVESPAEKVLEKGKIVRMENHTILISRHGRERQIADSGAPIKNRQGDIIGVVLVFRDVTDKYALEEQLRQTEKMNAIGHLAGGIAHDFNNMLSGIIGNAELLKMKVGRNKEYGGMVQGILNTSEKAADLINKLLAFARKGKTISTPVDIHDSIKASMDILAHSIDRRIAIELDLSAEYSTVHGDPSMLQNVILNLGLNARDAMPEGGRIKIRTENILLDQLYCEGSSFELEPGLYINTCVSDNGIGMSRETIECIFDPFFTTKEPGKGTGLGLSAVYGTVKEHHGAIQVESEPGTGTVFSLYLPVRKDVVVIAGDREEVPVSGRGRVLVVDDEEVIRTMLKSMLETLGYEVLLASHGEEAVDVYGLHGEVIDAVLLDMVMPKMDGRTCFSKLKEMDPGVRVIVSSGFTSDVPMLDNGQACHVEYVRKPYRIADLSRVLAAVINAGNGIDE